ncbi:MAG: hypothetical protein MRY57_01175, partial [Candidatus Pacebacteria bacterium]|nr:hypothetical protein [Candidatus Paceibacterota bacterium]
DISDTTTQFRWQCAGLNGGSTSTCSADWQRNGSCKTFGSTYSSQPATSTSAGCNIGNYANVSNTSSAWRWSCSGINGGSATTCSANTQYYWTSGAWGSCSTTSGTQTRSVTCRSYASGGTVSDSFCSETKPATTQSCAVAGSCISYKDEYDSQPATDTKSGCSAGTYNDGPDSSSVWNWQCAGLNGGKNSSCSAQRKSLGQGGKCINYEGSYGAQPATDTKSGCSVGTYKDSPDSSSVWNWQCAGLDGGLTAICEAARSSKGGGEIIKEGGSCDPEKSCCYLDSKGNWVEGPPCA